MMQKLVNNFIISKKDKPFARFLKRWLDGEVYSDIEVAKNLTSMLTHSLIELQFKGEPFYQGLYVPEQSKLIYEFLNGTLTQEELKTWYQEKFQQT